jgi:FkbM family methyltransferase
VPKFFEGILPVSPSLSPFSYEPQTMLGLRKTIQSGMTVFDIGCNFGVISVLASLLLNRTGCIHSFDGNVNVFSNAGILAKSNNIDNINWHHTLIGESTSENTDFYVIPALNSPASTRCNFITIPCPDAELRQVPMVSLDDFCKTNNIVPDIIKIDVEGSEYSVLCGAENIIKNNHPMFIIETHADEINGIMGSLEELVYFIDKNNYKLLDLSTNENISYGDYCKKYGKIIGYLLAYY